MVMFRRAGWWPSILWTVRPQCASLERAASVPVLPTMLAPSVPSHVWCYEPSPQSVPASPASQVSAALFIFMFLFAVAPSDAGRTARVGQGLLGLCDKALRAHGVLLFCAP